MTIKAVFWNTDSIYGDAKQRTAAREAVAAFAAQNFNQVALSTRPEYSLKSRLSETELAGKMVMARSIDDSNNAQALTDTLGSLNIMRAMAKATTVNADEVVVITDSRDASRAAVKAGMQSICLEGGIESARFTAFVTHGLNAPRP